MPFTFPQGRKSRHLLTAAAVALALGVTGCAAGGPATSTSTASAAGQTLIVNTSFVYKTLDPGRAYEQTGYLSVHALYSSLMTFEGNDVSTPVPNLAESLDVSEDGLTYTVNLRDGATFADETPITSADVVYSFTRLQNLKGSSAAFFNGLVFTAVDDLTVTITAPIANPTIPVLLAMPAASIVNSAVVSANGGNDTVDAPTADTAQAYLDSTSAGSGPYVLDRNDPGQEIVLVANENYWGEKPEYERVVIRNMDIQTQKLTLSRSTSPEIALDITGDLLEGMPETLTVSDQLDTIYFAYANTDPAVSEVTSNPDFLAAFKKSIDYDGLADLYGNGGSVLGGFIADVYPGSIPSDEGPEQDIDAAKDLLADSGLSDVTAEYIYPAITYRGVDLGTIATKIQGDVAKAGITLELTPLPLASFLEQYRGGQSEMGMTPQALIYPRAESIVQQLSPGSGTALRAGWTEEKASPEMVAAAKNIFTLITPEERVPALVEWQELMLAEAPFVPLAQNSAAVVSTPKVTDAEYTSAGWILTIADVKAN